MTSILSGTQCRNLNKIPTFFLILLFNSKICSLKLRNLSSLIPTKETELHSDIKFVLILREPEVVIILFF